MSDLKAAVMDMLKMNGWSADWQERSAVLHGEAAELTDAVRGKRGDPLEESADVLISLLAHSPYRLEEIVQAAWVKVERLAPTHRRILMALEGKCSEQR